MSGVMNPSEQAQPGLRLLARGEYAAAVSSFETALRAHPQDVDSWFGLARAQLALGKPEAARTALARTVALAPGHSAAQALIASLEDDGGSPEVLKRLASLAQAPGAGFIEHYAHAQALLRRGQDDEASKSLRAALTLQPESPQALVDLGQIALRQGRADKARDAFRVASGLAPGEWMPRLLHARALMALRHFAQAMTVLNEAVAAHPREVPLQQARFECALIQGEPQKALEAAQALETLKPGDANPLYQRGLALLTLGKLPEAAQALQESLRLAPEAIEPKHALAQVRTAQGQQGEALSLLEELQRAAPRALEPVLDLSRLYLAEDRTAEAERVLRALSAEHPEEPRVNLNLALALFKQDRKPEALSFIERVKASRDASLVEQARKLEAQIHGAPLRPPLIRG
ncbi:tetratricopeptide repeat protein [Archangium violaceum]|nr:tetratricopeptide repeat protein [Archangium violaceum]